MAFYTGFTAYAFCRSKKLLKCKINVINDSFSRYIVSVTLHCLFQYSHECSCILKFIKRVG